MLPSPRRNVQRAVHGVDVAAAHIPRGIHAGGSLYTLKSHELEDIDHKRYAGQS